MELILDLFTLALAGGSLVCSALGLRHRGEGAPPAPAETGQSADPDQRRLAEGIANLLAYSAGGGEEG